MTDLSRVPADDEIDLRELAAALRRRWRWCLGFMAAGLACGVALEVIQPQMRTVALQVNINHGPTNKQAWNGLTANGNAPQGPVTMPAQVPVQSSAEVRQTLLDVIPAQFRGRWTVDSLRVGKVEEGSIVVVTAMVPLDETAPTQREMQRLASVYQRTVLKLGSTGMVMEPGSAGWLTVSVGDRVQQRTGLKLIVGGLSGVVLGAAAALLADRCAHRVFSTAQLLQLMGYPLWAKLPAGPWNNANVQAELGQLAQLLDPGLCWRVLSVAQTHPLVEPLAEALQQQRPALHLQASPPLLVQTLQAPVSGQALGVLVVLECGFNSAEALQEARRVLQQLPGLQAVALALMGQLPPPELRR